MCENLRFISSFSNISWNLCFRPHIADNKCRTPAWSNGIMPWCYTNAKTCGRNYCDVCGLGTLYDKGDNCAVKKAHGLCTNPDYKEFAATQCAKTCNLEWFTKDTTVAETVTCEAPESLPDGDLVSTSGPYKVGDTVTYKCRGDEIITRKRTCLTNGQWTPLGLVCDVCPDGWSYHKERKECTKLFTTPRDYDQAIEHCASFGATIFKPNSPEAVSLLVSIISHHPDTMKVHLGATDRKEEWIWVWQDGTEVDPIPNGSDPEPFINWERGQPDIWTDGKHCGEVNTVGKWSSVFCSTKSQTVCTRKEAVRSQCRDANPACPDIVKSFPKLCSTDPDTLAVWCAYTCGVCDADKTPSCPVPAPSTNALTNETKTSLSRGQAVEYFCKAGFLKESGDEARACLASGTLSGTELKCKKFCPGGLLYSPESGACYEGIGKYVTFDAAQEICKEKGGLLVMPKTEAQFQLARKASKAMFWLGLSKKPGQDLHQWEDGEYLLGWTKWGAGDPEGCVDEWYNKWYSISCSKTATVVCEIPWAEMP